MDDTKTIKVLTIFLNRDSLGLDMEVLRAMVHTRDQVLVVPGHAELECDHL